MPSQSPTSKSQHGVVQALWAASRLQVAKTCTMPSCHVTQAMLTAPAMMGPSAGASTCRHPWSFSSHTSLSFPLWLVYNNSPILSAQDPKAVPGRQAGLTLLFWGCRGWLATPNPGETRPSCWCACLGLITVRRADLQIPSLPCFQGQPRSRMLWKHSTVGHRQKHWRNGHLGAAPESLCWRGSLDSLFPKKKPLANLQ